MPKKELNGSEIAGYIKQRQAGQVRGMDRPPKLVAVTTSTDPATELYLRIKSRYAEDIGMQFEIVRVSMAEIEKTISSLNLDKDVDAIIVQLPLADPTVTDTVLSLLEPSKDVDGLGRDSQFEPATPTAILWLLAGYNIDLRGKRIVIVGNGRLVGAPLAKALGSSDLGVTVLDESVPDLDAELQSADIVISATGSPRLISSTMLAKDVVVVDAGTSTDSGEVVGDVDDTVRELPDIIITPKKGGVGPLTVAALFENVLLAYRKRESQDA